MSVEQLLKKLLAELEVNNKELRASRDEYQKEKEALQQQVDALQSEVDALKNSNNELRAREIKESGREQYELLFQNLSIPFAHARIIQDEDGRPVDWEYIEVNPAHQQITGRKPEDVVGKRISEVAPNLLKEPMNWLTILNRVAETRQPKQVTAYIETFQRHMILNVFSPAKGEIAVTFLDQTESVLAGTRLNLALEMEKIRLKCAISHSYRLFQSGLDG